jgi:osmotically-inducible protein OsmY
MPQSDMGSTDATTKIQSAFKDNSSLSSVTVSTDAKGNIELSGTANSAADKKEAVRIAKENANGKKVKDKIKVGNGAAASK